MEKAWSAVLARLLGLGCSGVVDLAAALDDRLCVGGDAGGGEKSGEDWAEDQQDYDCDSAQEQQERCDAEERRPGLSGEDLAAAAGLDRSFYSEVESAKYSVSVDKAFLIAGALGVEVADLFTDLAQ